MRLARSKTPFIFKTQLNLIETTGFRATTLRELCDSLMEVPEASVYYHTHHFLRQHQFSYPEPSNDFAYWSTVVLQEEEIGERLASVNIMRFNTLYDLRKVFVDTLRKYLSESFDLRKAPKGMEFYFMKCISFAVPTPYTAYCLEEFVDCLHKVNIYCIYNHVFEGRLRPPLGINDFSNWLSTNLGEQALAQKIDELDPYAQSMESLRKRILDLATQRLKGLYACSQ